MKKKAMKKPVIAVIGHTGMVGGVTYRWFKEHGYKVMGLSLDGQTHTWEEINNRADWIFICVPTPFDWRTKEVDLSILREVLAKVKPGKKAIHKCTVPPGITQKLQKEFPELFLLFNPEFLSEATCDLDFTNPDRQLIGYTPKSYSVAMEALNLLPESPYGVIMEATEAEICKFVNNFHGAMMVIFANFFYDVSQKFADLDFERIKKTCWASKWVGSPMGRMYWDVFHGGFRGYGGSCFPKDTNILIEWCKKMGVPHELLEATKKANVRLLKNQGMTEEKAEKRSSKPKPQK